MNKHNQQFSSSFLLLQQEGYLISSCLATGLTELRVANVHNKGAFYSALFNLSVGMERLLKSIIIMEHMLNNNLASPTKKQLKNYGHNIAELYDTAFTIANNHGIPLPSRAEIDIINQDILTLLGDFAQTTRYHNLDSLNTSQTKKDPLIHWSEIILSILSKDVSKKQQTKILNQANAIASSMGNTFTIMQGLDKQPLSTEEALALPGLHDQAAKYAVFRVVDILSPMRDLISELSRYANKFGRSSPSFPQMQEFLEWLWNDKQYVLRKKRWP